MSQKIHTPLPLVNSEAELEVVQSHVGRFGPRGGMVFWEDGQEFVKIPLTKGLFTIIDRSDYENIGRFRWYAGRVVKTFYAMRRHESDGETKIVGVHNLLMPHPTLDVDHKDWDGLNNRRSNLRHLARGPNIQNSIRKSGRYKGISRNRVGNWSARIRWNYANLDLGTYRTPEEAALAYDLAALEIYGQDAWTNFPVAHQ